MCATSALGRRWEEEDCEFEATLGYPPSPNKETAEGRGRKNQGTRLGSFLCYQGIPRSHETLYLKLAFKAQKIYRGMVC